MKWTGAALVCILLLGSEIAGNQRATSNSEQPLPVATMVERILADDVLPDWSFYFDPEFRAVGSFSIHDHFGKRVCLGYLVSDGRKLSYRFIRSWPGLGSSNDAFQTELTNIRKVEYRFYRASEGFFDEYPERLSVKFFFDKPITGLISDWKKKDIKFDIWDVRFGYSLMASLDQFGVEMIEKS